VVEPCRMNQARVRPRVGQIRLVFQLGHPEQHVQELPASSIVVGVDVRTAELWRSQGAMLGTFAMSRCVCVSVNPCRRWCFASG